MARKKSNFVKPIGDLKWEGPSRRELEEDDKRFERILSFVPNNEFLRPMVVAYLKWAGKEANKDRKEFWKKLSRREKSELKQSLAILIKIWESSSCNESAPVKDADFDKLIIESEITYARNEIARYWVDVLLLAWEMWSKMLGEPPDNPILNDSFLPDTEKCSGVPAEWEEWLRKSEQSLRNVIALNDNDFNSVMQQFRDNIKKALQDGPVELPNDIDIVLDENNQPCLMARK